MCHHTIEADRDDRTVQNTTYNADETTGCGSVVVCRGGKKGRMGNSHAPLPAIFPTSYSGPDAYSKHEVHGCRRRVGISRSHVLPRLLIVKWFVLLVALLCAR